MKVTLAKLSICPCGFFAVSEAVPIGVEYEIDPGETTATATWRCGGCGVESQIQAVFVTRRQGGKYMPGWMPAQLFSNHPSNQKPKDQTTP
jgi:hypothetical protein